MKSPHLLLSWFALRALNPTTVIESGVWKGQGTWFSQQACPTARLHCIEPFGQNIQWRATRATYYKQDFSGLSWDGIVDKEKTVLFFDDHQDALERVRQAHKL